MTDQLLGRQNFLREVEQTEENINLARAALFFAQTEYTDLEPDHYLNLLDQMADAVEERLPEGDYPLQIINTINQYLFEDLQFTGNREDYYDPRNNFLNEVLERRTGIPITLSVIYLEIAGRLDFPMVGIGLPGHFIIRPDFEEAGIYVDPFYRGEILFEQDCAERLQRIYQRPVPWEPKFLAPVSKLHILARILRNLRSIYLTQQLFAKALEIDQLIEYLE